VSYYIQTIRLQAAWQTQLYPECAHDLDSTDWCLYRSYGVEML